LGEIDQSCADETDDREDGSGGGLYYGGEDSAREHSTEAARHESLQSAAKRIARESFQAFGKMVNSEQEQAESTQERYGGGGIHRLRLDFSFSNVEQNQFEIYRAKQPRNTIS
jgi:hypothetical protein